MTKRSEPKACASEILRNLSEQELLELLKRLQRLTKYCYYGPLAYEDLIEAAFEDVLSGRRNWKLDRTPFENLWPIIRSIASNTLEHEKKSVPVDDKVKPFQQRVGFGPSQAETAAEVYEQQEGFRLLIVRLRRLVQEDGLLTRLVNYLIVNPYWKPSEIAAALAVEPKEVYKARRRLLRKLKEFSGENEAL